ncbi:hypothetical protein JCM8208_005270 [Rhodotorula glutinis]
MELDPALAALSALSAAAHGSHDGPSLYSQDQLASFAQLSASFAPPAPPPPPAVTTSRASSPSQANIPVDSESDAGESDSAVPVASTSAVPAAAVPTNKRKLRSLASNGAPPAPPRPPPGTRVPREQLSAAEKAAQRKERNRIAAQKSRDKRQHEFDLVVADRDKWRQKAMRLEKEVAQLNSSLDKRLREARAEWEAQLPLPALSPDEVMPPEDLNFA